MVFFLKSELFGECGFLQKGYKADSCFSVTRVIWRFIQILLMENAFGLLIEDLRQILLENF